MKKFIIFVLPQLLLAMSPFDSPEPNVFNTSVYDTKKSEESTKASKNKRVTCRYVCDKKVYKEQQILDAVSFYKSDKNYKFILNRD